MKLGLHIWEDGNENAGEAEPLPTGKVEKQGLLAKVMAFDS